MTLKMLGSGRNERVVMEEKGKIQEVRMHYHPVGAGQYMQENYVELTHTLVYTYLIAAIISIRSYLPVK